MQSSLQQKVQKAKSIYIKENNAIKKPLSTSPITWNKIIESVLTDEAFKNRDTAFRLIAALMVMAAYISGLFLLSRHI